MNLTNELYVQMRQSDNLNERAFNAGLNTFILYL